MKLNLSVEGRILGSVSVDAANAANTAYIKALRRLMMIRHHNKLSTLKKTPIFFLEEQPDENRKVQPAFSRS